MKIVINGCFGGFSLSDIAVKVLGLQSSYSYIDRTDERLIALVEACSDTASGSFSNLRVVEIPDSATDWEIEEYDGLESIIAVVDGKLVHIA